MTSLHKAGIGNEISRLVGNSLVEDRINNSGLYTHIAGLERYATIEKFLYLCVNTLNDSFCDEVIPFLGRSNIGLRRYGIRLLQTRRRMTHQIAKRISGGKRGKRVKYFRDDMSAPLTRSRMYRMTD